MSAADTQWPVIVPLSSDERAEGFRASVRPLPGARGGVVSPRVLDAVRRHHQAVWRTLRRLGVREGDADDAAQHVFLTFARHIGSDDIQKDAQFLIAVAVRVAANVRRKRERSREVAAPDDNAPSTAPTPEALLQQKQLCERLDRGLATLPMEQRAVFVLFEIEGYSLPEIAATLGIPLGTATSRLRRARGHLEAWLRENPVEEP